MWFAGEIMFTFFLSRKELNNQLNLAQTMLMEGLIDSSHGITASLMSWSLSLSPIIMHEIIPETQEVRIIIIWSEWITGPQVGPPWWEINFPGSNFTRHGWVDFLGSYDKWIKYWHCMHASSCLSSLWKEKKNKTNKQTCSLALTWSFQKRFTQPYSS